MADELTAGSGTSAGGGDTGAAGAGEASSAIALSDTSLIHPPGADKPVTYKDFLGGYVSKADLTRMRQRDADALKHERETWAQQKAREEAELKRTASQLAQRLPNGNTAPDALAQLEQLPYVDGKTAAAMLRQTVVPLAQAIQQRDEALKILTAEVRSLKQGYGAIQGRTREGEVTSLVGQAAEKLGFKDNAHVREILMDTYRAYEGWEQEVDPIESLLAIAKPRIDGLRSWFREEDKRRAEDARRRPALPTQGGKARPGSPLKSGIGSSEKVADEMWAFMHAGKDAT